MSVPKNPSLLEEEEESHETAESMKPELYRAITEGDILEFVRAMQLASCVQLSPQKHTVLHLATSFAHHEIVKLLCKDLPIFLGDKNMKGDTALHIAARAGDLQLISLLFDSDFRESVLGEMNEDGNTAAHEALRYGHENVARVLIDKNRDMVYSVNKEGQSLLYLAAEKGYEAIVRLLMDNPVGNCSAERRLKNKSPVYAAILGRNIGILILPSPLLSSHHHCYFVFVFVFFFFDLFMLF